MIYGPCAAEHPGADDSWRCLFAEHRLPTVTTPLLLTAPLFDSWAVCHYVFGTDYNDPRCTGPVFDEAQLDYVNRFGSLTFDAAGMIAGAGASGRDGSSKVPSQRQLLANSTTATAAAAAVEGHVVWSAACYSHHVADRAGFFQLRAEGLTMADMVAAFLQAAASGGGARTTEEGGGRVVGNARRGRQWPPSAIEDCVEFACTGSESCVIETDGLQ
jgi:hypothetical protein